MGIFAKIIAELGLKLLTSSVVSQVMVYTLDYFAKKSDSKVDDNILKTVADALGVKDYK
jgi:hypothetical protein